MIRLAISVMRTFSIVFLTALLWGTPTLKEPELIGSEAIAEMEHRLNEGLFVTKTI